MLLPQSVPSISKDFCSHSLSSFAPFAHFTAFQSSAIIPAFQALQSISFPLCSKPASGQRLWCYSGLPTFPSPCTEKKKRGIKSGWHFQCTWFVCAFSIFLFQVLIPFIPWILYSSIWFSLWAHFHGFYEASGIQHQSLQILSSHWTLIHSSCSSPLWVIQGSEDADLMLGFGDFFVPLLYSPSHWGLAMREWVMPVLFPFCECLLFGYTIVSLLLFSFQRDNLQFCLLWKVLKA